MSKLVVFSGAGLSAESGIPTFRDKNGLWENHKVEDVADYTTWVKNHDLVQRFYSARRTQLGSVKPNAAHYEIAEWSKKYEVINLTQNIDDLLERAGCTNVVHLHGFLKEMRCMNESCGHIWDIGYTEYDGSPCPSCGHTLIKPNVVFFNEMAPEYSTLNRILFNLTNEDVVIVVGTMGNVVPISYFLDGVPSTNFLANLEPSAFIDEVYFKNCFYEPASVSFPKLTKILEQYLISKI